MNLHEYQSKQIFADYRIPVPTGYACQNSQQLLEAAKKLGGDTWVAKCQVHAGGRGKAGGVKLVKSEAEINAFAEQWFGKRLVTFQTDKHGQPVNTIYLEQCSAIKKELYLSAVLDRSSQTVVVMASTEGGMDIEEVAEKTPELLHKISLDPLLGGMPFQGRQLAFKLGLQGDQIKQFTHLFTQLAKLFVEKDLALVEVNPLVILENDQLLCLDAKIVTDSNASYRHPDLQAMQDASQEDPREALAEQWQLNYVALDGNIGCMVNGAGLAMGTMDIIKLHGGQPANFLDVGGGATKERVAEAFKIILSDSAVKAVLVNIFGGIVRCDLIANGIIDAVNQVGVAIPVVVRLEGNNAPLGREILANSGLNIIAANSLTDAAKQVVAAAEGK
ncbi:MULTISPECIES: ADP-forming succinate--CoA ligase subunit beta [Testudinibacter]|uniref:Succinate--CoA ligase [ADP-forming] subunit beta n=1 Tax=Testudinibacter aquarius TaxID=1524974 RepID=A0A4R3Y2X6_9PAST|nr:MULTISPECIES: ADP-forming succinate--CoA ligase subunit beta [Testudinibacter]TNH04696.1 ADP-forming succinate--CoA ligase subunit beta [Pasteurellaceae bacterium Phil31]TNH07130.1 ADP-forming succinate--CoA ligase subunit beta [Pasteurellaceae bacterium Phil11]KAE9530333.1 succinate--CoA ligase subunit beta [Testudinibacter aquarius]TCV86056.1 succinyl-CoA synthetase (ADP-forming) beta subunit [Testudinibacter aquarius]TNG89940.1 ADP-forming succinate--CoA ligase subunit beta [Testudinibac